ncbi:MAG: abortive phage resistance protein-like [Parachlamydiales bacterium]|nr:abortive phage resistance protein-like [Parachlamydiales bacterium]
MLIRFSVENWMSFQAKATFSLIASRERQHGERIPKIGKLKLGVLPVAAVYGGNASGKTNLFKALHFAKGLIVKGTQPYSLIAVDSFRLGNAQKVEQPVQFEFELLIDETVYAFSFSVNRKAIIEEKLVHISGNSEKTLYHRVSGEPNFDSSLKDNQSLQFAFKGTRDNQLFLTNSVSQKIDAFKPVYDWFKDTLELIAPDSRFELFEQFLDEGHPLYATMNKMLSQLDTGISHLGGEEIPFENLPLSEPTKMKLREELAEDTTVRLLPEPGNERFVVTRKNGELISKKLVTYHLNSDGSETKFDMRQESDGSQRVIDLLPAFLELSAVQSKKVYVIDEVDRSLHTLLIRHLLEGYLAKCSHNSRSQLLFTTHNVLLMDQDLLRRDEMWIAERNAEGISSLLSFSEYKDVRYDKDIRKSYLQGRLGGIPRILLQSPIVGSD